jgi:hypothetical protein
MRKILGPEVGARLKPIWGLDPEGEIQGVWRDIGIPRVWCMMGEFFLVEGKGTAISDPNARQGTLHCAGSTRSTSHCVSLFVFFHTCAVLT